jgi:hypothetical protein
MGGPEFGPSHLGGVQGGQRSILSTSTVPMTIWLRGIRSRVQLAPDGDEGRGVGAVSEANVNKATTVNPGFQSNWRSALFMEIPLLMANQDQNAKRRVNIRSLWTPL